MSEEKKGIKELKEAALGAIEIANLGIEVAKADGMPAKLAAVMGKASGLILVMPAAVQGAEQIVDELKDLSSEETEEMISLIESRLQVGNEKAVRVVAKALKAAQANFELAKALKG